MKNKALLTALILLIGHVALVAPFVPVPNILPASLGALAMTSMALALILAARWRVVDVITGGPDKSYGAHRFLGFATLLGALGHWALASSLGDGVIPPLAESGEDAGNLAAFGLLAMTAAAMIRAIPYHVWKLSHMLMGPVFLVSVYHTFLVASPLEIGSVPWVTLATTCSLGVLAWLATLLRKLTPSRRVSVDQVIPFEGGAEFVLRSHRPLPPFRAGQFATLAHDNAAAEFHPFSIAGGDMYTRRFIIRAGGDWTRDLAATLTLGDQMRLGQPEGRFLPPVTTKRKGQLWVAGGVGITPFMAALEKMQPDNGAPVTLIWCIRSRVTAGGLANVEAHVARLPQVTLVLKQDDLGEHLTGPMVTRLARALPKGSQAYLCGPEGLKEMVRNGWSLAGHKGRIHSERFDFRGAYGLTDMIKLVKPQWDRLRCLIGQVWEVGHALAGSRR
jgi:predicted ferric reductase